MALAYAGIDPKKALREQCLKRRSMIDMQTRTKASETLALKCLGWLEAVGGPRVIGGYMAIRNELDISEMMLNLMEIGHGIGLPVIVAPDRPLMFRNWDGKPDMPKTKFGVPAPHEAHAEVEPDIVLVPMLAFDFEGHRLGYGGGFYDRTLAYLRATRPIIAIGIAFDEQEMPRLPREAHDEPLDWILTQSGPRKVGG